MVDRTHHRPRLKHSHWLGFKPVHNPYTTAGYIVTQDVVDAAPWLGEFVAPIPHEFPQYLQVLETLIAPLCRLNSFEENFQR